MEWRRCRGGAESTDLDAGGGGEMELSVPVTLREAGGPGSWEHRRPTPGLGLNTWEEVVPAEMGKHEGRGREVRSHLEAGERAIPFPEDTPSLPRR